MNKPIKLLIVDDEQSIGLLIKKTMEEVNFKCQVFNDPRKALACLKSEHFDFGLIDIRMPGMDGLSFIKNARKIDPEMWFLMMTAFGSIENAVECIKEGAYNYITKPFEAEQMKILLRKAVEHRSAMIENASLRKKLSEKDTPPSILGKSKPIQLALQALSRMAQTSFKILLTGESGTGKELAARYIHQNSDRRSCPFVVVQCSLLPENLLETELFGHRKGSFSGAVEDRTGVLETGDTGTIFLDEIGDIDLKIQGKLLRFLQEHEIKKVGESKVRRLDVRFISATNKDLEAMVKRKEFREDLYYRLNVLHLHLPPLREHKEDIPILAQAFLDEINKEHSNKLVFDRTAFIPLLSYSWPGNVRELKNCIESATTFCEKTNLSRQDIEVILNNSQNEIIVLEKTSHNDKQFKYLKNKIIDDFETKYLADLLDRNKGSLAHSAKEAGMDKKNLWVLLKKHGLSLELFKKGKDGK